MTRIVVLIPTRGLIVTEVEEALDRELAANKQSPVIFRTSDMPLPLSRNFLVEMALKQDWWTHALLLDDDVILPKGGLKEMLKLNGDVVVTDYPMQGKIDGKFCGTVVHDNDGSVGFAGLGATLIKRHVFEKMEQPWFSLTQYRINRGSKGELGFYAAQNTGTPQAMSAGEDTYFYLQAKKHGFSIKETKKTAMHARIDQMVTNMHTVRYSRQHGITKLDKIERELI